MIGPPLVSFDEARRWAISELAARRWLEVRRVAVTAVAARPRNALLTIELEDGEILSCEFETAIDIKPYAADAPGMLRAAFLAAIKRARAKTA